MSAGENIYEWINSYLNGEMSREERAEFESRLAADEEFYKTFEAQKIAYEIVVDKELLNLRARIAKDLSGNYPGKPMNSSWKYFAGAAAAVALILVLFFLFKTAGKQIGTPEDSHPLPPTDSIARLLDTVRSEEPLPLVDTAIADTGITPPAVMKEARTCTDTLISFSCQARAACRHQDNGAIEIDVNTIKSGKTPFSFSVAPEEGFEPGGTITDLKSGKYNLYVKDAGNCIRKLNVKVEVPEIKCD